MTQNAVPSRQPAPPNPEHLKGLPVLPLRNITVFPGMSIPLFVGRISSVAAVDAGCMGATREIVVITQKNPKSEDPGQDDLYTIGCLVEVQQITHMPDGTLKVNVEGKERVRVVSMAKRGDYLVGYVRPIEEAADGEDIEPLARNVRNRFEEYIRVSQKLPPEIALSVINLQKPADIANGVCAHLLVDVATKQELLGEPSTRARLWKLAQVIEREIDVIQLEQKIHAQVRDKMESAQREYYLNEQIKIINKELGQIRSDLDDLSELREAIKRGDYPDAVRERTEKEMKRLERMPPMSPEYTVVRNYLGWITDLPWQKMSEDHLDIAKAGEILDADHEGLDKPKTRILEYLAVCKLSKKIKGPILCFVGPPGVGKTSLGRSVARSMGREFVRMSLGGVRDEAEIRGHRRTYIGALPGRILQLLAKAKVRNPVFVLDEIDKMSVDFRGDPSSALLEVLDPEQNHSFADHYMEIEFDLSSCLFIATANVADAIPYPLLDRMEIIELPGYSEMEKVDIALKHLVPKQAEANGIGIKQVRFRQDIILEMIRKYTNEAGVRNLERHIGKVFRQIAKQIAEGKSRRSWTVRKKDVADYLGVTQVSDKKTLLAAMQEPGVAPGLAWTQTGGDVLLVEAAVVPGTGKLFLTGRLGDVMQESGQAAFSFVKRFAKKYRIDLEVFKNSNFHIHLPEGGIPKDGPSAGLTIAAALLSAATGRPLRKKWGMTGEITLGGRVLPVGGLRGKLLAAQRYGLTDVLVPKENKPQIGEIPKQEIGNLRLHYVDSIQKALTLLFTAHMPQSAKR